MLHTLLYPWRRAHPWQRESHVEILPKLTCINVTKGKTGGNRRTHFGLNQAIPFPQNTGNKRTSLLLLFSPLIFWSADQVLGRVLVKTLKAGTWRRPWKERLFLFRSEWRVARGLTCSWDSEGGERISEVWSRSPGEQTPPAYFSPQIFKINRTKAQFKKR